MTSFKTLLLLFSLFLSISLGFSQSEKEKAANKGRAAVELMDKGDIDESIKLLKEAVTLDPDNFIYPYEISYALYLQKDYKGAIKQLEKLKTHKNKQPLLYQMLGNCYDVIGDSKKALKVYDQGIEAFPNAGMLYLEKGNVYLIQEKYNEALPFYEKGILMDPTFPSNYYRATLLYLSSSEEIWGMIYGEIFMNLERGSKRTAEISELLYKTYKSEITIADTSMSVSFCQNHTMSLEDLGDPKAFKLPFGMVYETTLTTSILTEKYIDLTSLNNIRSRFLKAYYKNGDNIKYSNVLFKFQNTIDEKGHFEAYNHWLLMKGNETDFNTWLALNETKWNKFIEWYTENSIEITPENKFHSSQF